MSGMETMEFMEMEPNEAKEKDEKDNRFNIPIWRKYTLTVQEASKYFRIGDKKLKRLIDENPNADYILWNGTRPQIKRKVFERFIDEELCAV